MEDAKPGTSHAIDVEHPVETALKKLNYRGGFLKIRDVFDIVVVDSRFPSLLRDNLHRVTRLKSEIAERLSGIPQDFCRQELDELDIAAEWRSTADTCLDRMRQIADSIPDGGAEHARGTALQPRRKR